MPDRTCYIMAGGQLLGDPNLYRDFLINRKPLFAADRGGEYLWRWGLSPEMIAGDFDSIDFPTLKEMQKAGVPWQKHPQEKDETDLEILAEIVLKKGFQRINILGAWGGRPDQTLGSIAVLHKIKKKGAHGLILNPWNSVEIIEKRIGLDRETGADFSLLPWAGPVRGLSISGCKYNVQDLNLNPDETRGLSNRVESPAGHINLKEGLLILIRHFKDPFGLQAFQGKDQMDKESEPFY